MTWRRPRSARTSFVTALFAVCAIAGVGCANDFDALFAGASPGAPEAGASDGGPVPGSDGSALDGALACGAPTACTPGSLCTNQRCSNECTGCGCSCPPFDCSDDDLETCITTCRAGSTCEVRCSAEKDCGLLAQGAVAKLSCEGRSDRCSLACEEGASCELTCGERGGDRCTAVCDSSSTCLVDCGPDRECNVDCQGGQKRTCPQAGVFTCNRDCPK